MADIKKIDARLKKEQDKLEALKLRKDEILKDIAAQEKLIKELSVERDMAELQMFGFAAEANDCTIAEVYLAMQTGDFSKVQEKVQKALARNASAESDTETEQAEGTADAYGVTGTDDAYEG